MVSIRRINNTDNTQRFDWKGRPLRSFLRMEVCVGVGFKAAVVQLPVFTGGAALDRLENAVKSRQTVEAWLHGSFCDGQARHNKEPFRTGDTLIHKIIITGHTCELLEQPWKVKLAEAGFFCQCFHSQVLCAVITDIITDSHKLFGIFVLLARHDIREFDSGV